MIISAIITVLSLILDQVTKFLIYGNPPTSIIGDLLWFESTLNTGVAFSMFSGGYVVFIITSMIAAAVMIYLIVSHKHMTKRFEKCALGFILGGTLGNLIDRIVYFGVRDFIYLKFINFAIFNIADMCITISAIALCVYWIVGIIKKEKK